MRSIVSHVYPILLCILLLPERLMSSIEQARHAVFSKMDGTDLAEPLQSKIERISKTGTSEDLKVLQLFILVYWYFMSV